ncbi:AAA family ATPase [Neorhizobium sp. T7_12]|uniref:AAA family ATPase n=1 Tax=Neorhizobium sp. T7_12 TaxID=2093832 RepID=UPI00155E5DB2|nr:AAA family ATPase [Neorhizobium sp. T7_12]
MDAAVGPDDQIEILLLTGPAGVGKSTLSWEISARLAEAGIAHATIESDELDRIFPRPSRQDLERLSPGTIDVSALTLKAIWSTYKELGSKRLILSGVMMHLDFDRRWITSAIPGARFTVVRLMATEENIASRLARRETEGSMEDQLGRSLRQMNRIATETGKDILYINTDGRTTSEITDEVLARIDWLKPQNRTEIL